MSCTRKIFPRRNRRTTIWFDPDFKRVLDAAAKRRGVATATFIRDVLAEAIGYESRIRGYTARGG